MQKVKNRFFGFFKNVFFALVPFALLACSTTQLVNSLTPKVGYTVVRDLPYGSGSQKAKDFTYDLYVPDGVQANTPVVVFFFGGGWNSGSKDMYLFMGQSLASEGFLVAIPNYRVYPKVVFPAFMEDAAQAVTSVDASLKKGMASVPAGDRPLFLMGHSAGAQIAALLTLDKSYFKKAGFTKRLAGFIGLAGPYDFLPFKENLYKRIFPERVRAASQPINFVGGQMPPMLLITGTDDKTVDPKNSGTLAKAVNAVGGNATIETYAGIDHVEAVSSFVTVLPVGEKSIRENVLSFLRQHARK
jgi:acetyl esterase/lipase